MEVCWVWNSEPMTYGSPTSFEPSDSKEVYSVGQSFGRHSRHGNRGKWCRNMLETHEYFLEKAESFAEKTEIGHINFLKKLLRSFQDRKMQFYVSVME